MIIVVMNVTITSSLTIRLPEAGLKPVDVGGQGDCFLKSVSHQIHGDAAIHFNIRMAGIRYFRDHPEIFTFSIITQVIIEILALSLAENSVIFRYNHLRRGDYSGRTNFQNNRLALCQCVRRVQ